MKRRKWSIKEQGEFLKKTGELLSRGYPLSEAIHSVSIQLNNKKNDEMIQFLKQLKEGYPLYKILQDLQFHSKLIGFVYYAEQHGSLANAFFDGSKMMLKRDEDVKKLRKVIFYPLLLIIMTIFLFLFVEKVLLPQYFTMYQSLNVSPNIFMHFVSFIGDIVPLIFFLTILFFLIVCFFYYIRFRHYTPVRQKNFLASLPLIGPFFTLMTTYYFSVQLSYLLKGGLSIFEALQTFHRFEQDPFDRHLGKMIQQKLMDGQKLEDVVQQYRFFEKDLHLVIHHGHANGKLDEELFFYSKQCLERLEGKMERLMKKLQPLLYSFIGLLIVSMYLAILLPMFQLLEGI